MIFLLRQKRTLLVCVRDLDIKTGHGIEFE